MCSLFMHANIVRTSFKTKYCCFTRIFLGFYYDHIRSRRYSSFPQSKEERFYDLVIVGGGIVGLAVAQEVKTRSPLLRIAVVEKEKQLASHQTKNNSGVIHAGVYYKPGSLRAKLCVKGLQLAYKYCDKHNIQYKKCGKLIVATNDVEVERLNELYNRAVLNNVPDIRLINGDEIKDIEPYCEGLKAIHSPHTGIVNWAVVAYKYGSEFERMGGDIFLNFKVSSFEEAKEGLGIEMCTTDFPIIVRSSTNKVRAKYVLTCGGLYSDNLAKMTGESADPQIIPFRGEYLLLKKDKEYLVKGNIYPVPDPRFPFLGVHFTPRMDGSVWLGPNAMLAFSKEGYRYRDINLKEFSEAITYPGLQRFLIKNISSAILEAKKSIFIKYQVKELQKFIPAVKITDVSRGSSGVRAQAMTSDGELVDDFVFSGKERILHCRNTPSPGATSSLAIGQVLANKVQELFNLS